MCTPVPVGASQDETVCWLRHGRGTCLCFLGVFVSMSALMGESIIDSVTWVVVENGYRSRPFFVVFKFAKINDKLSLFTRMDPLNSSNMPLGDFSSHVSGWINPGWFSMLVSTLVLSLYWRGIKSWFSVCSHITVCSDLIWKPTRV